MKSPTSIVNTLLESDHADYDPSLDPFSDPKNISHADLGHVYISKEDMADSTHGALDATSTWVYYLCQFGLISFTYTRHNKRLPPHTRKRIDSIGRIYIESVQRNEREAALDPSDLTNSAVKRVGDLLGPVDAYRVWPVKVVSVEYK